MPLYSSGSGPGLIRRFTMVCSDCHNHFTVETTLPVRSQLCNFCPHCGGEHLDWASALPEGMDYWYWLASTYNLPYRLEGRCVVKEIYDLWDPTVDPEFGDFVKQFTEEVA